MSIPKIIHQLWIGPKKAPINLMNSWKDKHPDYEYIFWNEEEFKKRGFKSQLQNRIDEMTEINGKADILRWEILYKYGGVFLDADSICIESFDTLLSNNKCFAGFENEKVRGIGWSNRYPEILSNTHPLIATGTMGFSKEHELPKLAIEWIKNNNVNIHTNGGKMAWVTVGPGLLTRLFYSKKWSDMVIYPSYYFLPIHCTGIEYYKGHEKIYAHQEWGSTKKHYNIMNSVTLPKQFCKPSKSHSVSILISSYNTNASYISECLTSIKHQIGHFNIQLVWINDGSDDLHTRLLKQLLNKFINQTRFTTLLYEENECNKGIGYTLNKGIKLCDNEIIIKMDSDDIMLPDRILKQYNFMNSNKDIHICGGQILMFRGNSRNVINKSNHKTITIEDYKKRNSHWFINHPTVCYRKTSVLNAGNYNADLHRMCEDFELELRMLNKYGKIYNFEEPLIYYRLHKDQVTHNGGKEGSAYWNKIRNDIIKKVIL